MSLIHQQGKPIEESLTIIVYKAAKYYDWCVENIHNIFKILNVMWNPSKSKKAHKSYPKYKKDINEAPIDDHGDLYRHHQNMQVNWHQCI